MKKKKSKQTSKVNKQLKQAQREQSTSGIPLKKVCRNSPSTLWGAIKAFKAMRTASFVYTRHVPRRRVSSFAQQRLM